MAFKITNQRQATMLKRIGAAAELIDNKQFLPFYRGVQIKLEKMGKADEWQKMIAAAKQKDNPSRYFAKLCKMVRDGTYQFVAAVKEVARHTKQYITGKLQRFGFNEKYKAFWVNKAAAYIDRNGMAGFVQLLEYAERKNINQRYFAAALNNGLTLEQNYKQNVMGVK